MRHLLSFLIVVWAVDATAETVVAARTIRPNTVLAASDLVTKDGDIAGGTSDPALLIGLEARVALYAGRPVRLTDVGPPAVIERNQIVPLVYTRHGLNILTDGRALSRASEGDFIRVMNTNSRATVWGRVTRTGQVIVSP